MPKLRKTSHLQIVLYMPPVFRADLSRHPSKRLSLKRFACFSYRWSFVTKTISHALLSASRVPSVFSVTLSIIFLPIYRFLHFLQFSTSYTILPLFPFPGNLRVFLWSLSFLLLRMSGLSFIPLAPEIGALYKDA